MATIARLNAILDLKSTGFTSGFDDAVSHAEKFASRLKRAGTLATAAISAPLVAFGSFAVNQASDLAEAQSAVATVYGDSAKQIAGYSGSVATSLGLSRAEALSAAAQFGVFAQSAGLTGDAMAAFSNDSLQAAADLASFYNAPVPEALAAIQSGLTGETEPLRRFGIMLSDAALQQYALEHGIWDGVGAMTEQQKVLARQGYIMANLGAAQGDFARTSGGLANSMRIAKAEFKDAAAQLGTVLLPYVLQGVGYFKRLVEWVQQLSPRMQKWAVIIGVAAAALGPLLIVLGTVVSSLAALGPVLAVLTGPIGLIVLAIAALAVAYETNFLGFADAVNKVIPVLQAFAKYLRFVWEDGDLLNDWLTHLPKPLQAVAKFTARVILGFRKLFDAIKAGNWRKALAAFGDLLSAPAKFIGEFLKGIETGFAPLDRLLHTLGKLWVDFGRIIQEVFQGDWAGALAVGERLLRHLWEAVQQTFTLIVAAFKAIDWSAVWDGLKTAGIAALTGLGELAVLAFGALLAAFRAIDWGAVAGAIWDGIQAAIAGAGRLLSLGLDLAIDLLGDAAGLIGDAWTWLRGKIPTLGELADGVSHGIKAALDLAATVGGTLAGWLGTAWGWLKSKLPILQTLETGLTQTIRVSLNLAETILGPLKDWTGTAIDWLKDKVNLLKLLAAGVALPAGVAVTLGMTLLFGPFVLIGTAVSWLGSKIPLIQKLLDGIDVNAIVDVVTGSGIISTTADFVTNIMQGIAAAAGWVWDGIQFVIDATIKVNAHAENVPAGWEDENAPAGGYPNAKAMRAMQGKAASFASSVGSAFSKMQGIVSAAASELGSAVDKMSGHFDRLAEKATNIGATAGQGFLNTFRPPINAAVSFAGTAQQSFAAIFTGIATTVTNLGMAAGQGFLSGIRSGMSQAVGAAQSARGAILSALSLPSLYGPGYNVGLSLGTGIAAGIQSMIAGVALSAAMLVYSAKAAADRAADNGSPSRLFAEVGRNMALGMAQGVASVDVRMPLPSVEGLSGFGGGYGAGERVVVVEKPIVYQVTPQELADLMRDAGIGGTFAREAGAELGRRHGV